ncbi:MAG: hypothetical protein ACREFP_27325 [Acetobacteraceae bacterium]
MRSRVGLVSAVVVTFLVLSGMTTFAQNAELAPQGTGLLPEPAQVPAQLGGAAPAHPFIREPGGWFSRVVFATDEAPGFRIVIHDYLFPPDRQSRTVLLPAGGLLHLLSGQGRILVADHQLPLTSSVRMTAPPHAPLSVLNNGEVPLVLRVLSLAPK